MDSRRAVEQLEGQQARIAELLRAASELLEDKPSSGSEALAALRWQLMRVLREYQLFKHNEIFDPLVASPNLRLAQSARDMKVRCIATGEAYAAHVARWSTGAAATGWDDYATETRYVIARITQHMARERREADILLAGVGRTRQTMDRNSANRDPIN